MSSLAAPNLLSSDGTTAQFGLGDEYNSGGNYYKYFKSGGVIAANALCTTTGNTHVAVEGTTTTAGVIPGIYCIPQFAVAAADEYFWAPIGPFGLKDDGTTFKVLAALNCATNVRLYTTATAGVVDDAVTAGIVAGLRLSETITTAEAADCTACQRLVHACEL
jgi:hypothetical protein